MMNLSHFLYITNRIFHFHIVMSRFESESFKDGKLDIRTYGIPARSHTFVVIDHEIISAVILLPSAESFKKGCCQLQAKVCARSTG